MTGLRAEFGGSDLPEGWIWRKAGSFPRDECGGWLLTAWRMDRIEVNCLRAGSEGRLLAYKVLNWKASCELSEG